jgi:hypothetical protein
MHIFGNPTTISEPISSKETYWDRAKYQILDGHWHATFLELSVAKSILTNTNSTGIRNHYCQG